MKAKPITQTIPSEEEEDKVKRRMKSKHTKFISVMNLRSHDGFFRTFADVPLFQGIQ